MALRDFWQEVYDLLHDAEGEDLTQEEIDAKIETAFSVFAGYTDDAEEIPADFRRRQREFYDPADLVFWIQDGGIPVSATWIHRHPEGGDYEYVAYVSPDTP